MWGTRFDAAPPIWSFDNANFNGANLAQNINIKILGAKHNDFSYSATDLRWTPNPDANKRIEREINFKTSAFMQNLYQVAKEEDFTNGSINEFLQSLVPIGAAENKNGVWEINPTKLRYTLDYIY